MRKPTVVIAIIGLGVALVVGGAGLAAAQSGSGSGSGPAPAAGWRKDFVCAHLAELQKAQSDHLTVAGDRAGLLAEEKAAADQAGATKAAQRIANRLDRVTARQATIKDRQQKLADFAAKNCGA